MADESMRTVVITLGRASGSRSPRSARRSSPGYGRQAYFWALTAALGVFVAGAAFSLGDGIEELIHPSATSSFAIAYIVLAISSGTQV
jgi:divalent metal cation (Fe/Co/Zn/Cd) transporter